MNEEAPSERVVYRSSGPSLVISFIGIPLALGIASAVFHAFMHGAVAGLGAYLLFIFASSALATIVWYPKIEVNHSGLVTTNLLWRYRIPWGMVESVTAGSRVEVVVSGVGRIVCWAVQSANMALMLHRAGRAERVAEQIRDYRSRVYRGLPEQDSGFRRSMNRRPLIGTAVMAVLSAAIAVALDLR